MSRIWNCYFPSSARKLRVKVHLPILHLNIKTLPVVVTFQGHFQALALHAVINDQCGFPGSLDWALQSQDLS